MNQLLELKHEFYQDGENQIQGETPDGEEQKTPNLAHSQKPEITEISKEEATWLVECYDLDEDGKLNLEEFAAIFMEKS